MMRSNTGLVFFLILLCVLFGRSAGAQSSAEPAVYPQQPINLIVGWSPGGAVDLLARQLGTVLSKDLGKSIVVENRAGASGTIAHAQAVRARPDGYTAILASNSTFVIGPHLYKKLPYQHEKDLAAVSLVAASPLVLAVNPALKVSTLEQLLVIARERPGRLNFASGGQGSTSHLAAELLMSLTGIQMTHIPYQGGAPAASAVMSGEVDIAFLDLGVSLPFLSSNRFLALAVSSDKRSTLLPEVPTVAESGVKDFEVTTTFGLFVPAQTPATVVQRLNAATVKAINDEKLQQKLVQQGVVTIGSTPAELRDYTARESSRWGKIIDERHITVK
ncbi:tripartite-type tricarboxylate transporter receptor subunit TctC [Advenella incenata]|jgi:tripartite-type tricarboxylate transporter receptor subunit TctC|uniref:Tripartite-type tricarboxylate transporter receptor subunit TctC n=1 Tax=Advenella incenata TaxID=267800 RepID=A0A4V2FU21_9BURK|nr:tripartite tricarboxylate transporter substrate binding protein [Advenella incenata]RZU00336.1 tripartite-type tricarboxylate transporter receptor subunit TctC [Advenella incenata]